MLASCAFRRRAICALRRSFGRVVGPEAVVAFVGGRLNIRYGICENPTYGVESAASQPKLKRRAKRITICRIFVVVISVS